MEEDLLTRRGILTALPCRVCLILLVLPALEHVPGLN